MTSRPLLARLQEEVLEAWRRGWQPAEMVRVIRKRTTARHAAVVVDAIAAQMREYAPATVDDRWRAQLAELNATVGWTDDDRLLEWWSVREGLPPEQMATIAGAVIVQVGVLPAIGLTGPLPGEFRPGQNHGAAPDGPVDERMLAKVRALLAKAESTTFPEEAEAYTAKAQELMARHSIDHALLMARSGARDEPATRRVPLDAPYEGPKVLLLQAIATANRARCAWAKNFGFATVIGFPADLDAVELLFTSLLVQAVRAMSLHPATSASFRRAFLTAYAHRIGERLNQASQAAEQDAAPQEDLLPVLRRRSEEVQRKFTEVFPAIRTRQITARNEYGWAEGRAAADRADLHGRAAVRAQKAHSPARHA